MALQANKFVGLTQTIAADGVAASLGTGELSAGGSVRNVMSAAVQANHGAGDFIATVVILSAPESAINP